MFLAAESECAIKNGECHLKNQSYLTRSKRNTNFVGSVFPPRNNTTLTLSSSKTKEKSNIFRLHFCIKVLCKIVYSVQSCISNNNWQYNEMQPVISLLCLKHQLIILNRSALIFNNIWRF